MKKILLLLLILLPIFSYTQSSMNMNLLGTYDYNNSEGNDIWGWVDANGNEYALVGLTNGFSCVNVTSPSSPFEEFFISDVNSIWRDVKTWGNYAYVTTEANAGLLIIDLTDMTGSTYTHVTQFTNNNGGSTSFTSAHNIYIDESGIAYIFGAGGSGSQSDGAIFLDVMSNPTNPVYLGEWDDQYIHDGMVKGDTMWVGCINTGKLYVVDVSNKSNPITIGSQSTPNNFTHNAWVSDNGDYVFTTDETSDAYLAAYNVSDLNNIYEVDRIQSNPGSNSIPHNTFVDGNFLITSYYRDGTTVHDITYPNNMIQVAYYDSYSGSGNGFDGCWGTYPYLPSGNIISSDINSGPGGSGRLLIYSRNFQQASFLSGNVTNSATGLPINNATIQIVSTSYNTTTNLLGDYSLGSVNSGVFQVVFSATGYIPVTLNVTLSSGNMIILNAALTPGSGLPGCTDPIAINYDPNATVDDGSCIYCSGTWVSLNMYDTYGDGWNGNTWTATSTTGGTSYGPFTISNGSSGIESFCLPDDCYDIVCDYGTWQTEVSWTLTDVTGTILLSGGAPYSTAHSIGSASCVTTVVGCMNANAANYNPNANTNIAFGGILDPNIGTGAYYNGNRHLVFDAYVPSKIVSSDVYSYYNSNTITFELRDNNSTVIDDTTITVNSGQQRLFFDFDVPIGNDFQLGIAGTNSGLYRNNGGVSYPYDIGGLVSITGSNAASSYYYFFYDIEVEAVCTGISSTVYGCTNPLACNYDPLANNDDGSCLIDYGCMDPLSTNYDPLATCDDGSCFIGMPGCTDPTAINYNPLATIDDGSCIAVVYGCTDQTAYNYYAGANIDDGSCCYAAGCTDPLATNYDANACIDDGSCSFTSACANSPITGLFISDIIDDQVLANFDNMNTYDATGAQICRVDQIRIKYREVGTSAWSQKNIASPTGYDPTTGVCNSTQKTDKPIRNLTPATEYEWEVKVWYCNGGNGGWAVGPNFTTAGECPNVGNLTAYGANPTKATFDWDDSNGSYEFARIKMRVDSISNPLASDWFLVGGSGVSYGTFTKNKNGLVAGETYRGQARTWCDPNGGAYNALSWTSLVTWTQPTVRLEGGASIANLDIYPNPSRDVFNITFTSESIQDLKLRVLNVIGEELIAEDLQQFIGEYTKQINLEDNAKGIYFLEIETNDGIINKKLIIQ